MTRLGFIRRSPSTPFALLCQGLQRQGPHPVAIQHPCGNTYAPPRNSSTHAVIQQNRFRLDATEDSTSPTD